MGNYSIKAIFDKEPVAIAGAVRVLLMTAVLFGLAIDEKQLAGIALALEIVLTLFVRSQVTPVESPTLPVNTTVNVVTPEGEPNKVVTV